MYTVPLIGLNLHDLPLRPRCLALDAFSTTVCVKHRFPGFPTLDRVCSELASLSLFDGRVDSLEPVVNVDYRVLLEASNRRFFVTSR